MVAFVDITESVVFGDLRNFLLNFLPTGVEVVKAQDNRVPEPTVPDFVVMTPLRRDRLATNIDSHADCTFTGSISSLVLTVSGIQGEMTLGGLVWAPNLPYAGCTVVSQLSGTELGDGTYQMVAGTPDAASGPMANSFWDAMQETKLGIQLDVHGPNSANNSQIVSTLMRDIVGYDYFLGLAHGVAPLYADDPKQVPFENDQQQVEFRWIIEAELQANITVSVPFQYAGKVTIGLIPADVIYPP